MKYKKLSKCAEISVGFPFKSTYFNTDGVGIRLVRGKNVGKRTLRWADDTRWWNDLSIDYSKYFLNEGDIVISMDGSLVGKNYSRIKSVDLPLLLVQRVACIRANEDNDQDFIWHCISNKMFESYIDSIKTGTTIPHISANQIGDYLIPDIELETQKKIGGVFKLLDDRISNNIRINKNLYA